MFFNNIRTDTVLNSRDLPFTHHTFIHNVESSDYTHTGQCKVCFTSKYTNRKLCLVIIIRKKKTWYKKESYISERKIRIFWLIKKKIYHLPFYAFIIIISFKVNSITIDTPLRVRYNVNLRTEMNQIDFVMSEIVSQFPF